MLSSSDSQIFYDKKQKRWIFSRAIFSGLIVALAVVLLIVVGNIFPDKDSSSFKSIQPESRKERPSKQIFSNLPDYFTKENPIYAAREKKREAETVGFYVNWDDESFLSLKNNIDSLDKLIPEWIHLSASPGEIKEDDFSRREMTLQLVKQERPDLKIVPLINNFDPETKSWSKEILTAMLESPENRERTIQSILRFVQDNGFSGISIDFENVPSEQQVSLQIFMQELYEKFHPLGLEVSINVPLSDEEFNLKALGEYADYIILLAYDEHTADNGISGPVASGVWYETYLKKALMQIPPHKVIIALGNYGYDWSDDGKGRDLTFQEAMLTAQNSGVAVSLDSQSLNPTFRYFDQKSQAHSVWFLDAVSLFNQISLANRQGEIAGFALWRLGSEDPSVWRVLGNKNKLDQSLADSIRTIDYQNSVTYQGDGEILRLAGTPQKGERDIIFDGQSQLIIQESITKFPISYAIERQGKNLEKKIALTFDDGPDDLYTVQVLDILKRYDINATFFVIGAKANMRPHILRRMYQEGNEIGVHTYSHPDINTVSFRQFQFELNSVQELLKGILGHGSLLFRPPYAENVEPELNDQVTPLAMSDELGYYTVAMHIDPHDWKEPGASVIANEVSSQVVSQQGNVVLLHDGGGNRNQTIEALPQIIEKLKSNGYQFVTVSELMGLSRDEIMPAGNIQDKWSQGANKAVFNMVALGGQIFYLIFLAGIVLGSIKLVLTALLAIIHEIYSIKSNGSQKCPPVSVIIPAFNEEKVIVNTVQAVLASKYPSDLEVIIVDDGSTDSTYFVAKEKFKEDFRVSIFSKVNEGKARALNFGLEKAQHEIVVTLDADTIFQKDTIEKIVRKFSSVKVAAVAGNAKVGNRVNLLTRWQALEYITSQNLDRRAFEMLNCISVVPGSVGAWKKSVVREVGGFSCDTLAEDTDLTMTLLKRGYYVNYASDAVGYTEAPDSMGSFLRQRFRWMYGTIQSTWKHRDALLNEKYGYLGFLALPNVLIFQVLFPLLSPLIDLILIFSLFWVFWQKHSHPESFDLLWTLKPILLYYAFFLIIDLVGAIIPFALERKENRTLLFWLPFQRFLYRQLMYWVAVKSIVAIFRGGKISWGRQERKATVAFSPESSKSG